MSLFDPNDVRLPPFYRTASAPCPYLGNRMEQKLFTVAIGEQADALNSLLTANGFRRSHDIIYKPDCPGCSACIPVRIHAAAFAPNKTLRRIIRRNEPVFSEEIGPPVPDKEQFKLFSQYQKKRHQDSDMAAMNYHEFAAMMCEGNVNIRTLTLRERETKRLMGVMIFDCVADGVSAVYSFFDPEKGHSLSLGKYMVARLANYVCEKGLDYIYLGYWVGKCRKMSYKAEFQPLEALTRDGWVDFKSLPPQT